MTRNKRRSSVKQRISETLTETAIMVVLSIGPCVDDDEDPSELLLAQSFIGGNSVLTSCGAADVWTVVGGSSLVKNGIIGLDGGLMDIVVLNRVVNGIGVVVVLVVVDVVVTSGCSLCLDVVLLGCRTRAGNKVDRPAKLDKVVVRPDSNCFTVVEVVSAGGGELIGSILTLSGIEVGVSTVVTDSGEFVRTVDKIEALGRLVVVVETVASVLVTFSKTIPGSVVCSSSVVDTSVAAGMSSGSDSSVTKVSFSLLLLGNITMGSSTVDPFVKTRIVSLSFGMTTALSSTSTELLVLCGSMVVVVVVMLGRDVVTFSTEVTVELVVNGCLMVVLAVTLRSSTYCGGKKTASSGNKFGG